MGIFDDIVSPVKNALDNIVRGVEVPIDKVESIFGEVIRFTDQLVKDFLNMIEDLRTLFNATNVEIMFVSPFKEAALTAIGDVKKLYALIIQASAPLADGVKDDLMIPINAVYSRMRSGMRDMTMEIGKLLEGIEREGQRVSHNIYSDFNRVKASLEAFPIEISMLKNKIERQFKVVAEDAFNVLPDVPEMLEKEGANAFHAVKTSGQVISTDLTGFESALKRRFDNENAVLDFFYIVVLSAILVALVSVFMITKSISLIINIIIMILVAIILYILLEVFLGAI
jgi:hypothetical protein